MFDAVWPSAEAHAGAARRHLGGQLRPRRSRAQLAGSARGRLCGAATTRRCVPHTHLSSPGLAPKADSTLRSSRAVPHPSTNRALRRLTSEVRRDPVHSTRYGRQRQIIFNMYQMFLTWKKDGTHHSEDASVYWQECSVSSNLGGHCSLLGKILKLHLQRSRHRANVFSHLPAAPHACQHFI